MNKILSTALLLILFAGATSQVGETPITNSHEHIETSQEVPKFLEAMKANGIEQTVILGSPEATFQGEFENFAGYEKNNDEIFRIAATYPGRFLVFPTLDMQDPDAVKNAKHYLEKGARGFKLYAGYRTRHVVPIDRENLLPLYAFCEEHGLPVLMHVNAGYYLVEFERTLVRFPNLKIVCPHFCLSTIVSDRLEHLMDTYPQLYTDISFGPLFHLKTGLLRFSRDPEKYRALVIKYQDRIFFGTDMVVSRESHKTAAWMMEVTRAYRDLLEKDEYTFFALPGITLKGLHLDQAVLEKIYRGNFEQLLGRGLSLKQRETKS